MTQTERAIRQSEREDIVQQLQAKLDKLTLRIESWSDEGDRPFSLIRACIAQECVLKDMIEEITYDADLTFSNDVAGVYVFADDGSAGDGLPDEAMCALNNFCMFLDVIIRK
jgi:hypothetical protein